MFPSFSVPTSPDAFSLARAFYPLPFSTISLTHLLRGQMINPRYPFVTLFFFPVLSGLSLFFYNFS